MITYVGKSFWIVQSANPILITLLEYDKDREMYRAHIHSSDIGRFEFWIKRVDFVHARLKYENREKILDRWAKEMRQFIEHKKIKMFYGWDASK